METLTFLFTDIEGSTALLRRLGDEIYAGALGECHSLIRSAVAANHGEVMNTQGDGAFAVFTSPRECLLAVWQAQQAMAAHPWPGGEQVRVRMGAHTGEAARTDAGLVGLGVHRAARVGAAAHGGQVLLSETLAALVVDSLPDGVALEDLGEHLLKDLAHPQHLFQLQAPDLQSEFPPPRSLGSSMARDRLPAPLTSFVGRDAELARLGDLIGSSRLITLTGTGGCGKTRLSLEAARGAQDLFTDGVQIVELAAVADSDSVQSAICESLRIKGQRGGRAVVETIVDALESQDVLIVLDNCEHVIDACAKIAEAILRRCPKCRLLATSREPLGVAGEAVYRLAPLSLPKLGETNIGAVERADAVALFLERARAQGVDLVVDAETAPILLTICRQLDGLPLALELAAARLPSLSLADLDARLRASFGVIASGSRTALERQQTLEATVDWSYSLLNGAEQTLLRRLSVFVESFGLRAAEEICGFGELDVFDIARLVSSLVDKSLVVPEPWPTGLRYRLLETVRQFAARELGATAGDSAPTGEAHCAHYLALVDEAAVQLRGPAYRQWFVRLDADQPNIRRAAKHAVEAPAATATVLRFGVSLRDYWMARGRSQEAVALLVPVLQRPDADQDSALFSGAIFTAACMARSIDMTLALQLAERAVDLARRLGDEHLLIDSLAMLCGHYYFAGEPKPGLVFGEESVERARQLGDDRALAESLLGCLLATDAIDPKSSEDMFAEGLACARRSGHWLTEYLLSNNAGVHALRTGDLASARAYLGAALHVIQGIGETGHNELLINLGWVMRGEGDLAGARLKFTASLKMSHYSGDHSATAYSLLGFACLAADAGDWKGAALLHGVAQSALNRAGESWQEPEAGYRAASLRAARAAVGDGAVQDLYARGEMLDVGGAIRVALGEAEPG